MKIIYNLICLSIILACLINFGCSKKDDLNNCIEHSVVGCNEDSTKVNIRISNVSEYDFCNVVLNPNGENTNYGIIDKNQSTCYRAFESAYGYAFVELKIDGNTFTIQPTDFVGETPLEIGNYTYQIDANESQEQYGKLSLTLVID